MNWPRLRRLCAAATAVLALAPATLAAKQRAESVPWGLDAAFEIGQFDYEEPGLMEQEGLQYGLFASYTHHFFGALRAQAAASVVGGDVDYDGGVYFYDPATGKSFTRAATGSMPNAVASFRLTGGWRFGLGPVELTPFTGYGYRYLWNDMDQPLDVEGMGRIRGGGYVREQRYHYLPLGVLFAAPLGGGWRIEAASEYDVFLRGRNHSSNDDMDNTYTQTDGEGYRFAVTVLTPVYYGRVRFSVEPFYEHWRVGKSDVVFVEQGGLAFISYEPRNRTDWFGLRFGARL